VEILEHEQHRRGGCPVGDPCERLLEHAQLRAGRRPICSQGLPERPQCLDERRERQLCPDKIDRAPDENLAAGVAGASGEFGHQAGLADAGFSGDEDGRTAAQVHRVEHAPERLELTDAADEDVARANLHLGQYGAATTDRQCRLSITQPGDTAPSRKR